MDTLLNDLRYATRMAWKTRVVTLVAVASLAAGIGANSAVFSLANAILLRPRAVADPDRLEELYSVDRQQPYQTSSYPSYLDFRDSNGVFSGLAAYGLAFQFKLLGPTDVEQMWGEVVSGNYFEVLGVRLELGRAFLAEEDRVPNRNPVVVTACGVMALLLAAIGIYGIVTYSVAQRHREVGIRMALGALGRDILALIIQQGMVPVAYGIAAGLALGLVLTRALSSLPDDAQVLFGVSATDPLTFGGVTAFLGLVALTACYLPARRAAHVDPIVTLRDGS